MNSEIPPAAAANRCRRCGRVLKDPEKKYGPVCAKRVREHDGIIELFDKEGQRTAVIV